MLKISLSGALIFVLLMLASVQVYAQPAVCDQSPEIDLWFDDLKITYTKVGGGFNTVVLEDFSYDPYQDLGGGIFYPPWATPAAWPWTVGGTPSPGYVGYGQPATLERDTTVYTSYPASLHFHLPANANNLDDIYEAAGSNCGGTRPNQFLCDEGPILMTVLRDQMSNDRRTLDDVLSDLGQLPIDYTQPITFSVMVMAKWDGSVVPNFTRIEQGINVFNNDATISNNNYKQWMTSENGAGWQVASIQVTGQDSNNRFQFGIRGSLDYAPGPCGESSTIPTLNEWGMIIFMVLALFGAVHYLRKQRTRKG